MIADGNANGVVVPVLIAFPGHALEPLSVT